VDGRGRESTPNRQKARHNGRAFGALCTQAHSRVGAAQGGVRAVAEVASATQRRAIVDVSVMITATCGRACSQVQSGWTRSRGPGRPSVVYQIDVASVFSMPSRPNASINGWRVCICCSRSLGGCSKMSSVHCIPAGGSANPRMALSIGAEARLAPTSLKFGRMAVGSSAATVRCCDDSTSTRTAMGRSQRQSEDIPMLPTASGDSGATKKPGTMAGLFEFRMDRLRGRGP
jgi:hypothetical protein